MPLQIPTYEGGNSRQALSSFVTSVRDFLDELVRDNRDHKGASLFVDELLVRMRAAWQEGRPVFESIAQQVTDIQLTRLTEHGLSGEQLRFKFSAIRYLNERFADVGKGALRKLLGAIDTLLKSIIKAAGLGDAAEELKDFIEKSIDD